MGLPPITETSVVALLCGRCGNFWSVCECCGAVSDNDEKPCHPTQDELQKEYRKE
jgi:hypothetical protein